MQARYQWGFKGLVVSDYACINEMMNHGLGDLKAVSELSLIAGMDMEVMGEGFFTILMNSLKQGKE